MTTYPKPKPSTLREAFKAFGVNFVEHKNCNSGKGPWNNGLRAATVHHTAGKNSADYLMNNFNPSGANCVINNGNYNGAANDGRAVILSWGDTWHSGAGGPWSGVAGKDSLHLVSWGIEIESLGTKKDITAAQKETVGRMLAALVSLGMPRKHIHRHEDWTDGSGPVGGYPLATNGRKIDTADDLGYTTALWVDLAKKYEHSPSQYWDGVVPPVDPILAAEADPALKNKAAWRLACRLADILGSNEPQPCYTQGYPVKAMQKWQASKGYEATGKYGPKADKQIWGLSEVRY